MHAMKKLLAMAMIALVALVMTSLEAEAQQCGPRQVFDPGNVSLGRLACAGGQCDGGLAEARVSSNGSQGDAELVRTLQAMSATISEMQQKLRAHEQGVARPMGGGSPNDVEAYARASGGGGVRPLYVVNNRQSAGTEAFARASSSDVNELPPLAVTPASDVRASAVANAGGCGGGRAGILSRLGGRRSTSRSVAITRTVSR